MRMYKTFFIFLALLFFFIAIIFIIGLWNFKKQTIYSHGKIYDTAQNIERSMKDRTPIAVLYLQAIAYELRSFRNILASKNLFMLLLK